MSVVFLSLIPFKISLLQRGSHQPISLFMCKLQEQGDIKNSETPYLYYTNSVCIASLLEVQLNILYTLKSKHSCPLISQDTLCTQKLKEVIWFILFPWLLIWPLIFPVSKYWQTLCQNDTLIPKGWNYKETKNRCLLSPRGLSKAGLFAWFTHLSRGLVETGDKWQDFSFPPRLLLLPVLDKGDLLRLERLKDIFWRSLGAARRVGEGMLG